MWGMGSVQPGNII